MDHTTDATVAKALEKMLPLKHQAMQLSGFAVDCRKARQRIDLAHDLARCVPDLKLRDVLFLVEKGVPVKNAMKHITELLDANLPQQYKYYCTVPTDINDEKSDAFQLLASVVEPLLVKHFFKWVKGYKGRLLTAQGATMAHLTFFLTKCLDEVKPMMPSDHLFGAALLEAFPRTQAESLSKTKARVRKP